MGLPETTDHSVYQGLKDVLKRYPLTTTVTHEPDSIVRQFLRAQIDLGPVHFQYHHPEMGERNHESAQFEKSIPTEILWTALDRLFEEEIPTFTGDT